MPLTRTELKDIQSLLTKKGRKLHGRFLAEGVRLLEEAVRHRVRPDVVYYAEALLSERAEQLLGTFRAQHVETTAIPVKQLEAMSNADTPQGVVGVFAYPPTRLDELYLAKSRRVLLCENIADPGNLGTLIRSALAFDFDLVVLAGTSAEAYAPKVVRSSAGAVFGVGIAEADTPEVLELLRRQKMLLLAADTGGEVLQKAARQRIGEAAMILAVGSESHGLSAEILAQAAWRVRIDHSRAVESLNAAVAGSILMKELYDLMR